MAATNAGCLRADAPVRALRLGVGGPVGTGKSSLVACLCRALGADFGLAVVTNDIYTDEDARFLREQDVLAPERIHAVRTGCCPHTAIRDDVTANVLAVEHLEAAFRPDVVLIESGGDNLTACFSPALVDAQIFVLDCAGGDDVPRKGGPGIERADLLVINKTDLAPHVGANVERMLADAVARRQARPVIAGCLRDRDDVEHIASWVRITHHAWLAGELAAHDPGAPAPHRHPVEP
jgi:urease accessory protein